MKFINIKTSILIEVHRYVLRYFMVKQFSIRACCIVVALCLASLAALSQSIGAKPTAILVEKSQSSGVFDTICQFQYEDLVLTEDSITFLRMGCIHDYYDQNLGNHFFTDTYLVFSFPNRKIYTMELFNYFSSYYPAYIPIWYKRDFGNTLKMDPYFFRIPREYRTRTLHKFVHDWNAYGNQMDTVVVDDVVLTVTAFGQDYFQTTIVQGVDTVVQDYNIDHSLLLDFDEEDSMMQKDTVSILPDKEPEFPGSRDSLQAFIARNIQHPMCDYDCSGTVLVEFLVEEDGSVILPRVVISLCPEYDKEALRVIGSMPKWIPALRHGKPARTFYYVPVTFHDK